MIAPRAPEKYDPKDEDQFRSQVGRDLSLMTRRLTTTETTVGGTLPAGVLDFIIASNSAVTARVTPVADTLSFGYTIGTTGYNLDRTAQTLVNFADATTPYALSLGTRAPGDVRYVTIWFYEVAGGLGLRSAVPVGKRFDFTAELGPAAVTPDRIGAGDFVFPATLATVGDILPVTTLTPNLGSATKKWNDAYIARLITPHMTSPVIDSGGLVITAGTLAGQAATFTTLAAAGLISANLGLTVASGQTLTLTGAIVAGAPTWSSTQTLNTTGFAATLQTPRAISISGDLAWTVTFDGSAAVTAVGTLATVASAGTTGSSTAIPVITIDAKGRTTSITTAAVIAPAGTLTGATLANNVVTSSLTTVGVLASPHMTGAVVDSGGFTVTSGTSALQATTVTTLVGTGALSGFTTVTFTGDLGTTGTRITKGWFTDFAVTNAIAGSITGSAATLTTPRAITMTGDVAWTVTFDGSAAVSAAGTLASVATAGATGSSTAIPVITINAKGLTTSITTAAVIAPAGTLTGTMLATNVVTSSLTTVGVLASPHFTSPVIDSGGLTITSGTLAAQATTVTTLAGTGALSGFTTVTFTGDLGATGTRITKGWFTDLAVTNAIAGSITGSAATLTTTRTIWGQNFNGSANVSGAITGATTGAFSGAVSMAALTATTGSFTGNVILTLSGPTITLNDTGAAGGRLAYQASGANKWIVSYNYASTGVLEFYEAAGGGMAMTIADSSKALRVYGAATFDTNVTQTAGTLAAQAVTATTYAGSSTGQFGDNVGIGVAPSTYRLRTKVTGGDNVLYIETATSGDAILSLSAAGAGGSQWYYKRSDNTTRLKAEGGADRLVMSAGGAFDFQSAALSGIGSVTASGDIRITGGSFRMITSTNRIFDSGNAIYYDATSTGGHNWRNASGSTALASLDGSGFVLNSGSIYSTVGLITGYQAGVHSGSQVVWYGNNVSSWYAYMNGDDTTLRIRDVINGVTHVNFVTGATAALSYVQIQVPVTFDLGVTITATLAGTGAVSGFSGYATTTAGTAFTQTVAADTTSYLRVKANATAQDMGVGVYDSGTNSGAAFFGSIANKNTVIIANNAVAATFAPGGNWTQAAGIAALQAVTATSITATGLIQTTLTTQQQLLRYSSTRHMGITLDSFANATFDLTGAGGIGYGFKVNGTYAAQITDTGSSFTGPLITIGVLRLGTFTVATLPAGVLGDVAAVTDATVVTAKGIAPVGLGGNKAVVFFNGTIWVGI